MEHSETDKMEYKSPSIRIFSVRTSHPLAASTLENPEEGENWEWD